LITTIYEIDIVIELAFAKNNEILRLDLKLNFINFRQIFVLLFSYSDDKK